MNITLPPMLGFEVEIDTSERYWGEPIGGRVILEFGGYELKRWELTEHEAYDLDDDKEAQTRFVADKLKELFKDV